MPYNEPLRHGPIKRGVKLNAFSVYYLSCPIQNVHSRHTFNAAGTIVTNQRLLIKQTLSKCALKDVPEPNEEKEEDTEKVQDSFVPNHRYYK